MANGFHCKCYDWMKHSMIIKVKEQKGKRRQGLNVITGESDGDEDLQEKGKNKELFLMRCSYFL